jgi:hypothetical protein
MKKSFRPYLFLGFGGFLSRTEYRILGNKAEIYKFPHNVIDSLELNDLKVETLNPTWVQSFLGLGSLQLTSSSGSMTWKNLSNIEAVKDALNKRNISVDDDESSTNATKERGFWKKRASKSENLIGLGLVSIDDPDEYYLSYVSRFHEIKKHTSFSDKIGYLKRKKIESANSDGFRKKIHDLRMIGALCENIEAGLLGDPLSAASDAERKEFFELWAEVKKGKEAYRQQEYDERSRAEKYVLHQYIKENIEKFVFSKNRRLADKTLSLPSISFDSSVFPYVEGNHRVVNQGDWIEVGDTIWEREAVQIKSPFSGLVVSRKWGENPRTLLELLPEDQLKTPENLGDLMFKEYLATEFEKVIEYRKSKAREHSEIFDPAAFKQGFLTEVAEYKIIEKEIDGELKTLIEDCQKNN